MFFVISKLLLPLLLPFTWVCILLLASLLIKKKKLKRGLLIAAAAVLLIFSNPFLLNTLARSWDINTKTSGNFSCAIVLGGFTSEDLNGKAYFNQASDRYLQALKLKNSGTASKVLFTGGNASIIPNGFRESIWAAKETKYYGVPDSAVLIEKDSRNTFENAQLSAKLLKSKNLAPPYLVVTSAFHMRRALMIFKKAGVDVKPYSSHYGAGHGKTNFGDFIPSADALADWNTYIKEMMGYLVYSLK